MSSNGLYKLDEITGLRQRDLELLLITAAFLDPLGAREQAGWLDPAGFSHLGARTFWQVLRSTDDHVRAAAEGEVFDEINQRTNLVDPTDVGRYAKQLARTSHLVRLTQLNSEMAKAIGSQDYGKVEEVAEQISHARPHTGGQAVTAADAFFGLLDVIDNVEERSIKTYIPKLDAALGGVERQTLLVLAARPSMGKSTLAWQMAQSVAFNGKKALYFSLEMSRFALCAKTVCGDVGIRWRDVRKGQYTDEQHQKLLDAITRRVERLEDRLLIYDEVPVTTSLLWQMTAEYRPDLVIVDHLSLMSDDNGRDNETIRLGKMSWALKSIAKSFDCAMVCITQLNRGVEHRDNKRPQLSDLRDSGKIEENADTVLMLFRENYYDDEATVGRYSDSELLIRKFRDDVRNQRVGLKFDTNRQWFGAV